MNSLTASTVSVIIVNYNGAAVLGKALDSVHRLQQPPLEIVVVDNGSDDDSVQLVKSKALINPHIRLVVMAENRGVAGGRNVGVEVAQGDAWAFLDADGEATDQWLPEAVTALNADPAVGAVAPLVLMDQGYVINGAGSFLDAGGHGYDRYWGDTLPSREGDLIALSGTDCDFPMGCGMVLRRDGLEGIWPLDDSSLKWHDDTEIGIRIRKLGYRVVFCAGSRVLHQPGHSDPQHFLERHLQAETARFRLLIKYYPITVVAMELSRFAMHAVSGSRHRPEAFSELGSVLTNLKQDWRLLYRIRRQWQGKTHAS
ncbi:MAG: glycosyltransferase [Firmicutes bacterium]|nr:glycosyltransferase [Bacillota bacterium]